MLFSSIEFILLYLPLVVVGFFLISKYSIEKGITFLVIVSLIFYGYWNPAYIFLLVFSVLFNYFLGIKLSRDRYLLLLIFGVTANLSLLVYFKYLNFFVANVNELWNLSLTIDTIVLPLAISFFTFQQIAYLVDSYKGETKEYNFAHYCLFVTFFPQLIAGPIVHHKQLMSQFGTYSGVNSKDIYLGLSLFSIGLFKKVVVADSVAPYANVVFSNADSGLELTSIAAWLGALCYTVQLYFDFSGYADMAVGAAKMFGIQLPINFNSPYKSINIVDFWRRWHITLSTFLRDYLYVPLGGNRKGENRKYFNLLVTMLLGGMWHGAGWNFLIWGALHGFYLCFNHFWIFLSGKLQLSLHFQFSNLKILFSHIFTMLAVIVAWVFFRAETLDGAILILNRMSDLQSLGTELFLIVCSDFTLSDVSKANNVGTMISTLAMFILVGALLVAFFSPNSNDIISRLDEKLESAVECPNLNAISIFLGAIFALTLLTMNSIEATEFLYFQF